MECVKTSDWHSCSVDYINHNGKIMFTSDVGKKITKWKEDGTVDGFIDASSYASCFVYGGGLLYTSYEEVITVWNHDIIPDKLKGHTDTITCLEYYDDILYSGSMDSTIKIWKNNECIATMYQWSGVTCIRCVDDILYSGGDGVIRVWEDKKNIYTFHTPLHTKTIQQLIHSNNILHVVAYSYDGTCIVQSWKDEEIIFNLKIRGAVHCAACDDMLYIGEFKRGIIDAYRFVSGTFKHHQRITHDKKNGVTSLSYNNGMLYSGHNNGTIKVWKEVGLFTKAALK